MFILQTIEDLWVLKSIIELEDIIKGSSYRRQRQEGQTSSERKPIFVSINIDKFDYSGELNSLRFTGKIIESKPSDLAPVGEHHTLEIKLNEKYTLIKNNLYNHQIDLLKKTSSLSNKISLVVLDDEKAEVFQLTDIGVKSISSINSGKHGKRYNSTYDYTDYFEKVYSIISESKDQLIIAGPGHIKSKLHDFIKSKSNSHRIIEVNLQNVSKSSINELFTKKEVSKFFENSLIFKEQEMLDTFKEHLGKDNGKAIYGLKDIKDVLDQGIIQYILISENLWKSELDKIQELIINADKLQTKIHIVDSAHEEIIKTLQSFTGIIAVLRYKIN